MFSFQNKYYNILLPEVFQNLQDLDEKRTKCFQNFILKSCMVEKEVLPIISQCLDGMEKCAEEIGASEVGCDSFLIAHFSYISYENHIRSLASFALYNGQNSALLQACTVEFIGICLTFLSLTVEKFNISADRYLTIFSFTVWLWYTCKSVKNFLQRFGRAIAYLQIRTIKPDPYKI